MAVCTQKAAIFAQALVSTCKHTSVGDPSSKISLPIFFKRVSGVVVAKPLHKMHIGVPFVGKRHVLYVVISHCTFNDSTN
jgi:hypothetical protein